MRIRLRSAALLVGLSSLATLTLAPPAHAAVRPIVPVGTSDFVLTRGATYLPGRVADLDAELLKSGVQNLLDEANRVAVQGCIPPGDPIVTVVASWCLNSGDSSDEDWYPQGITGTGDAQADDLWGTKRALLVSWYDGFNITDPYEKGVRVSFLDTATGNYRHVLLVWPYYNSFNNISYGAINIHAGGVVWYGNYLYVVDTDQGIRVFDMRDIFDLGASPNGSTSDPNQIGRQSGVYHAHGYRYVMPQVGAWINPNGNNNYVGDCDPSGPPKFSYVSLDRSEVPDSLITGEYCNPPNPEDDQTKYGRIARWPLDASTGELSADGTGTVRATEAYRLPDAHIQGATAISDTFHFSQSAGEFAKGRLITGRVGENPTEREAGIGPEDLYYWPARNQLWTVTEHPGKRSMYAVTP
ncbi:MAG: hypothetical protein ACRDPK_03425 [Carbonactinosporaceae bacterium]